MRIRREMPWYYPHPRPSWILHQEIKPFNRWEARRAGLLIIGQNHSLSLPLDIRRGIAKFFHRLTR